MSNLKRKRNMYKIRENKDKNSFKRLNIEVPADFHYEIKDAAHKKGMTIQEMIILSLLAYLEENPIN